MIRVDVRTTEGGDWLPSIMETVVGPAFQRAGGKVRDRAKANITIAGRIDTGTMRNQIVAETVEVNGSQIVARVEARAPYSRFQHEGTANDGTGYIYPRRARVLRFTPRGGSTLYRPKVRGVKGVPFLKDALDTLATSDFT